MGLIVRQTDGPSSVVLSRSLHPSFLNSLVYRGCVRAWGLTESTPDAKGDIQSVLN